MKPVKALFLSSLLFIVGCSQEPKTNQQQSTLAASRFEDLRVYDVIPTVDGGAYIVSRGQLFYARGEEVARVREVQRLAAEQVAPMVSERERFWYGMYQQRIAKSKREPKEREWPEP